MRKPYARFSLALVLLAFVLLAPASPQTAARQKRAEFGDVVKLIETHFGVRHKGLPILAKLPLKVAGRFRRLAEIGSVKLASFEEGDFSVPAAADFAARLRERVEPEWQPLVETRSAQEGSQTHIYTLEAERFVKVLVIQINRRDALALQVSVTPENLGRLLRDPEIMGETLVGETANDTEP